MRREDPPSDLRAFDRWNRTNMNRHLRGDPQDPPDDDWEPDKTIDDYEPEP